MLSIQDIEALKQSSEMQAEMIKGGVLYLIIENDTFTWRLASKSFKLSLFQIGEKLAPDSVAGRAIREKRRVEIDVPASLYGVRLRTVVEPLLDEEGNAVGAYSVVFPRLHPIVSSFGDFAPGVVSMFNEGAVLYVADKEKMLKVHQSQQFQVPALKPGYVLSEGDISRRAVRSQKPESAEYGPERFGTPVLAAATPVFDDEDPSVLLGIMGMIIPKAVAAQLRLMSGNMETGLEGITQAIEQMADFAANIHKNEQALNGGIQEILQLSEKINALTSFIKNISEQTNMLGLNAAIEAARVGEAGKGFGVVAQEIRKLSEQTKETVPRIKELTDNIKLKVEETNAKSLDSLEFSQSQAAATEEINATIEEISTMSEHLAKIAQQI